MLILCNLLIPGPAPSCSTHSQPHTHTLVKQTSGMEALERMLEIMIAVTSFHKREDLKAFRFKGITQLTQRFTSILMFPW